MKWIRVLWLDKLILWVFSLFYQRVFPRNTLCDSKPISLDDNRGVNIPTAAELR